MTPARGPFQKAEGTITAEAFNLDPLGQRFPEHRICNTNQHAPQKRIQWSQMSAKLLFSPSFARSIITLATLGKPYHFMGLHRVSTRYCSKRFMKINSPKPQNDLRK